MFLALFLFSSPSLLLARVLAAKPDEMRLSRQTSLLGVLTSKRWCVAVWGFRLVGSELFSSFVTQAVFVHRSPAWNSWRKVIKWVGREKLLGIG